MDKKPTKSTKKLIPTKVNNHTSAEMNSNFYYSNI